MCIYIYIYMYIYIYICVHEIKMKIWFCVLPRNTAGTCFLF